MPPDPNQGNYQQPPGGYQPPPPPPGGQPGYGAPAPAGAYQSPTGQPLAEWPQRALAGLIDYYAPFIVSWFFFIIVRGAIGFLLGMLLWLAGVVWGFYNAYLNGQTGQSFGKQTIGLKVVNEETGQLIGGGQGIVRYLAHIIDGAICGIGYLFPLWDPKKQTIADKIIKTVVVVQPKTT